MQYGRGESGPLAISVAGERPLAGPVFSIGAGPRNFGHPGMGGAIAFADPDRRMSFSYSPNRMSPVADTGPWAKALIEAAYRSL